MTTMTVPETLKAAADHIERVGLHKGDYYKDYDDTQNSPCCTLGALKEVTGYLALNLTYDAWKERVSTYRKAENALIGELLERVPAWNDKDSQRKGKVVKKLRDVAAKLETEAVPA